MNKAYVTEDTVSDILDIFPSGKWNLLFLSVRQYVLNFIFTVIIFVQLKFLCQRRTICSAHGRCSYLFICLSDCLCLLAFTFYSCDIEPTNNVYTDTGTLKSLLTATAWLWCWLHRLKLWSLARFNYLTLLKIIHMQRRGHTWMEGQDDRHWTLEWEKEEINQERDNNGKRMEIERHRETDNKAPASW